MLAKVETLKTLTVGGERKIEQNPQRLKMLAQGYMAQLLEGKEAITALNNYLNTLNQISNSLSDLAMIKSKWQASIIKTQLNIAHKHYINNDIVKSHKYLKLSFANLREYIEENTLAFNTDLHNALVSWSDLALATNFTENTKEFNGYLSGAISEIKKLDTENPSVKRLLLRLLK